MDQYYQWLTGCLKGIAGDMPSITASAEAAAKLFVQGDRVIGAWGDPAFVEEFTGRAGGLMPVHNVKPSERRVSDAIILIAPSQDHLEEDLKRAVGLKRPDCFLVLFAGPKTMEIAKKIGARFDSVVNTHSAKNGGLFQDARGTWVIPTDRAASIAALWTWTGEFVSACTRLGKMTAMWQSLSCPGSEERARRLAGVTFHDAKPEAVPPGKLGREYLAAVSQELRAIHAADQGKMLALAGQAAGALKAGRRFYVAGRGHATGHEPDGASNPGVFTFIQGPTSQIVFQPGDLLFCVGYDAKYQEEEFGRVSGDCRKSGGTVAWSLATYGDQHVPCVAPGDTLIDQRWELGDAVVAVPGYDIRILPPSGVIAEAVLWMVVAEATAHR